MPFRDSASARNVLIIVAIALAVAVIPGGGSGAAVVVAVLVTGITVAFVLFGARMYRENRVAIFGLGDRWRGVLYGSLGTAVLAMGMSGRLLDTGAGTMVWFAMMGGALYGMYATWRHHRSYG